MCVACVGPSLAWLSACLACITACITAYITAHGGSDKPNEMTKQLSWDAVGFKPAAANKTVCICEAKGGLQACGLAACGVAFEAVAMEAATVPRLNFALKNQKAEKGNK